MRLAIAALALLNAVLLAAWSGLLEPLLGNGREPHRLLRQVRPERLRIAQIGWPAWPAATQGSAEAAAGSVEAPQPSPADATLSSGAVVPDSAVDPASSIGSASPVAAGPSAGAVALAGANPSGRAASPAVAASSGPAASVRPRGPSLQRPSGTSISTSAGATSACIEWGAFSAAELPSARQAAERAGARTETVRRTLDPKAFVVYLPPAPDQTAAQARADELQRAGIAAYVLSDGPYRWAVSLGVFRGEQSAQALRQSLHDRGLTEAQVGVRGPERWALRLHSAVPLSPDRQEALSADFGGRTLRPCSA